MRLLALALALLAASAAMLVLAGSWPGTPAAAAPPPAVAAAATPTTHLTAAALARGVRLPEEWARCYPPGTEVRFSRPLDPRDFASGIACPGGGFLPLLNGVPSAPALHRNVARDGPLPPVIGKHVDADGGDWYVHADRSETTTRWMTLRAGGVERPEVRTVHTVPAEEGHGLTPPGPQIAR